MRSSKANIAGLISPAQQAEMKSILAGTWPPLKPLPVFKYETVEYRAVIDFDKKRGEWVCRKTSLPSNKIQELRGGLREISMALPHGEAQMFIEGEEPQGQELEKDTNRRLQATHEWREKYKNGALYFELRDHLSESQRTEMDDSLRLSLTARQLQFNAKNVAYVFDALSTAGGRFATLLEFAKRSKAKGEFCPLAQGDGAVPEAEGAMDHGEQSLESGSQGVADSLDDAFVGAHEAAEPRADAEELPAVSITNVLAEQEQAHSPEPTGNTAPPQCEIEPAEIVDEDSPSLVKPPYEEQQHSPAFAGFVARLGTGPSPTDGVGGSSSRFPVLELSVVHVAVFSLLFLFVATAFTVGLRVGRGSVGGRFQEAAKSAPALDAKSPALPDRAVESASRTPAPGAASSNGSGAAPRYDGTPPAKEASRENAGRVESLAEGRYTDSDSFPARGSKSSPKLEANSEHGAAAVGVVAPRSPALQRLTPATATAPRSSESPAILVRASQPFRASFPQKTIAATSSLAMSAQISVLVTPEPGPAGAHNPARVEAAEMVSFVWPRYPKPEDRNGLPETIRVRATIGQLGQVQGVKFLGGAISLLPATVRAMDQWRYRPALLDKRPVQAQEDVTIEYGPPRSSSQLSARRTSHN